MNTSNKVSIDFWTLESLFNIAGDEIDNRGYDWRDPNFKVEDDFQDDCDYCGNVMRAVADILGIKY